MYAPEHWSGSCRTCRAGCYGPVETLCDKPWQMLAVEQLRSRCLPRDVKRRVLVARTMSHNRNITSVSLGISHQSQLPNPAHHNTLSLSNEQHHDSWRMYVCVHNLYVAAVTSQHNKVNDHKHATKTHICVLKIKKAPQSGWVISPDRGKFGMATHCAGTEIQNSAS